MGKATDILNNSRKIVVKIGSQVLSNKDGLMDKDCMESIANQITTLIEAGKQVIIVSSGAEVSGVSAIGKWNRHGDLNYKQAMCAIGQVELMMEYKKLFKEKGLVVGQLLLSHPDFADSTKSLYIRNTIFTLLDEKVIPIINENDSVSVDEFSIGDNDTLASFTSNLWNADLLILMSDIDGLYNVSPKVDKNAKLIREVDDIDELMKNVDASGKGDVGTGGMETKIQAARTVSKFGTSLLLVNGKTPNILGNISEGDDTGTIFIAK